MVVQGGVKEFDALGEVYTYISSAWKLISCTRGYHIPTALNPKPKPLW